MKKNILLLPCLLLFIQCSAPVKKKETLTPQGADAYILAKAERADHQSATATGTHYAVSTQGIFSTQAAKTIFAQNGNIIDAAVAVSFAIAVERPHSTGLGGGGFMLYREGKTKRTYAIDFRERAPLLSTEKMFLKEDGNPDSNLSQNGILSVGVPGMVAGLIDIHARFGKLPLVKVMAPAIALAENGFAVYPNFKKALDNKAELLKKDPAAREIFLDAKGNPWPMGHMLIQKDLARTLRRIAKNGKKVFYKGEIGEALVKFSADHKGLLSKKDLLDYQVKWREPVKGNYKGYEIFSMPPPSSGGIHVVQFLNQLENDNLKEKGLLSTTSINLAAQSLQAAFADRAEYLGDPDFVNVPTKGLTDKEYAARRRKEFYETTARPSQTVGHGFVVPPHESTQTTHFSIMDYQGNAVASTQTINGQMGASMVVPHTGIVLNNEMNDFSAKPGASNLFGAIGSNANAIVPKKTPLSSMSPTIVMKDGLPKLAIGAPGGTRIISCVAQSILNYIEFNVPLYESITMIRYHHQWLPDVLDIDPPGPRPEVLKDLERMGYKVQIREVPCSVMAVARENKMLNAASDPRDIGTSAAN
ncbi:MAG: gamma-glutamyltransferase [Bacteriovorax sp.]|nr:gamma-glutamyltransferase [Bacteriovorax sp.]